MTAHAMNHFTILAEDLAQTCAFYRDLLSLTEGYRPDMGFPGAWLYAGDQAVLHVVIRNPLPQTRAGVLDHMAFSAVGLVDTVRKLEQKGLKYSLGRQVETTLGLGNFLANLAIQGLPMSEYGRYIANLAAVTPDQVAASVAAELDPSRASIVIVGRASEFLEQLRTRYPNVEVIPFGELDLGSATLRGAAAAPGAGGQR